MKALFLAALVAPALAGCLGSSSAPLEAAGIGGLPLLQATLDGPAGTAVRAASGAEALLWTGKELEATHTAWDGNEVWLPTCWTVGLGCPEPNPVPCEDENCERIPFTIDLAADYWATHDGFVEVSIAWDPPGDWEDWFGFDLEVLDADGKPLGKGRGGLARVVLLEEPPPGAYEARVVATWGQGAYAGAIQVEAQPAAEGEARDLLPNLVVLPPQDLRIEYPGDLAGWFTPASLEAAMPSEGCGPYEALEGQARRCLRLSNAIGNTGEGPLEVRLSLPESAKAMAAPVIRGEHVQRIHRSDGTFTDLPAGPAVYHPTHSHFHYDGLSYFAVYEYDLEAQQRGALVNEGKKGGVCLVDIGLVALGLPHTPLPNYDITCFASMSTLWSDAGDLFMSLSPNWYDLYGWGLDDMYVDITGVEDGVYDLVSATNTDGSITESDPTDNEASVVFRLAGDTVEVLMEKGGPEGARSPGGAPCGASTAGPAARTLERAACGLRGS